MLLRHIYKLLILVVFLIQANRGISQFGSIPGNETVPGINIKPTDVIHWSAMQLEPKDGNIWIVGIRLLTKQNFTLYTEKVEFFGPAGFELIDIKPPPPKILTDPISGQKVSVYSSGNFFLTFQGQKPLLTPQFALAITYLGCTETICLLPYTAELKIPTGILVDTPWPTTNTIFQHPESTDIPKAKLTDLSKLTEDTEELQQSFADRLQKGELTGLVLLIVLLLGGIATNLTPCVFPMIPITIRILGSSSTPLRGSILYSLGIVMSYSSLGILVALTGGMFGALLANPVFNIVFAVVFCFLALSMLGYGNYNFIQSLGSRIGSGTQNSPNPMLMGMGAGLVAAPCTGPILGSLITFASQSNNPDTTPLLFFVYSFGFAFPYLLLGMAASKVSKWQLPAKAQISIKILFAAVMFALALYYLKIPLYFMLDTFKGYWAILSGCFFLAGLIILLLVTRSTTIGSKAMQTIPVLVLGIGMFSASQWIQGGDLKTKILWLPSIEEGFALAKKENKLALIDGWAEWCVACKQMDNTTFRDKRIIEELANHWISIKIDFTTMSDEKVKIGETWGMLGLPTTVLVDNGGDSQHSKKLIGYQSADNLLRELQQMRSK